MWKSARSGSAPRDALLLLLMLVLTCALAGDSHDRKKRQVIGGGNILSALGGLASGVLPQGLIPQGLLQQLQGAGQPVLAGPEVSGGGYGEYYPGDGAAPQGVRDALETLVRRDTRRCVPRLVCEFAAGALPDTFRALAAAPAPPPPDATPPHYPPPHYPPYASRASARQEVLAGADAIVGLLTLLAGGGDGAGVPSLHEAPLAALGRAALLGAAARGRPYACFSAYPACPRDPQRLLLYLNNHRGGLFRFFAGPPGLYDGYYRNTLQQSVSAAEGEARGRALAATPSDALPLEHRALRRSKRALGFPEAEDGQAIDGDPNAVDSRHERILSPDHSNDTVRFPTDGPVLAQNEDPNASRTSRMRFPRDFKDSAGRIVAATAAGASGDEILAESYDDSPQRLFVSYGNGGYPGGSGSGGGYYGNTAGTSTNTNGGFFGNVGSSSTSGVNSHDSGHFGNPGHSVGNSDNGSFGADEYIITSGGNEYPLSPGQTPQDFVASLSSYPQGSSSFSHNNQQQYTSSGNKLHQYQESFGNTGDNIRTHDSKDVYQMPQTNIYANNIYKPPSGSKVSFLDDSSRPISSASYIQGPSTGPKETRKGRGGFGNRLRFPKDEEDSGYYPGHAPHNVVTQLPRPLPMVFPDRTGTGDLRLDSNEIFRGPKNDRYRYISKGSGHMKVAFPGS